MQTTEAFTEATRTVTVRLTSEQAQQLLVLVKRLPPGTRFDRRQMTDQAKQACNRILTREQRSELQVNAPAKIITGLPAIPCDKYDPSSGRRPQGLPWVVDAIQLGMLAQIGYPIGYPDEYGGAIVHEIAPANHMVSQPKKSQQSIALAVHSDRARFPDIAQCDVLTLFGMRNPEHIATQFAPVAEVINRVPRHLRSVLFEPRFDFSKNGRFLGQRPILRLIDGELIVCLPPETLPCDPDAMQAQEAFRAAVIDEGVVLEPGTMLLIRNRTCLHWRNALESPRRWLRRAYCILPAKYEALLARNLINPRTFVLSEEVE